MKDRYNRIICWIFFNCPLMKIHLTANNIFLTACLVLLFTWTCYNVRSGLSDFSQRYTSITLNNYEPIATNLPAVTICAPAIFSPEQLANLFASFKEEYQIYWQNLQREPSSTLKEAAEEKWKRVELFRHYESLALERLSALEVIQNYSLREEAIIAFCGLQALSFKGKEDEDDFQAEPIDCATLTPMLESIYEGKKCFTYFSDFKTLRLNHLKQLFKMANFSIPTNSSLEEQIEHLNLTDIVLRTNPAYLIEYLAQTEFLKNRMYFDLNPSIRIEIRLNQSMWSFLGSWSASFILHPPNALPNRFDSIKFKTNTYYQVKFTKRVMHLMKRPWKTMCESDFYQTPLSGYDDYDQRKDDLFSKAPIALDSEWLWSNIEKEIEKEKQSIRDKVTSDDDDDNDDDDDDHQWKYRNRNECLNVCINAYIYKQRGCANYHAVLIDQMFTNFNLNTSEGICGHKQQNYTEFLIAQAHCEDHCPLECLQSFYDISRNTAVINSDWFEAKKESSKEENDFMNYLLNGIGGINKHPPPGQQTEKTLYTIRSVTEQPKRNVRKVVERKKIKGSGQIKYFHAKLSIKISPKPIQLIRHRPIISEEEFFGYLGGHLGIWLGLSLFTLIDFGIRMTFRLISWLFIEK